jgi:hypothetical protein
MHKTSLQEDITVSFWIPGLPPSPNQTKGLHWSKLEKTKKEWMQRVRIEAQRVKKEEYLQGVYDFANVDFCISVGDNRRHDPDNLLFSTAKLTLDSLTPTRDKKTGIVTPGIFLADDSIDHVKLSFSFNRDKPRGFLVTITGR